MYGMHLKEDGWTKSETKWNSEGLNAIFMVVSPKEFKRNSICEVAKKECDILEVTHEGTRIVKETKI